MKIAYAQTILSDTAIELGLATGETANPFASTDQNIILLCSLLSRVGKGLVRSRDWTHLTKEHSFEAVNEQDTYDLPTDFARYKVDTGWNRTQRLPFGPALGNAHWQELQAQTTTGAGAYGTCFRIFGNTIHLRPTPTNDSDEFVFEYISSHWVQITGQGYPTDDRTGAVDDLLWFDETLLFSGLKLAFLRAKGFDTTSAQAEYDKVYAMEAASDGAANVLHAAGRPGIRLLDENNLPVTGYGS